MLYLSEEDVRELLPMRDAIGLMRGAFDALAQGKAINQPRRRLILDTGAGLHSMAGSYGRYFGTKFYSTHPRYGAYFYFVLYDAQTAQPLAWMEANRLGQIRTGARQWLCDRSVGQSAVRNLGCDRFRVPSAHSSGCYPRRAAHPARARLEQRRSEAQEIRR